MRINDQITRTALREIIEDFAGEINNKKDLGPKPSKAVINYRREHIDGKERDVYQVPIECLRFRKDNGRITSDIKSYEKLQEPLLERSDNAQSVIRKLLKDKDPELTKILKNSILHSGQRDPAIITCDGFLINGNRRKLVLEELSKQKKEFQFMKVVILPGKNDPGGPPTLLEIEQIENRYQLQSEGKAEYYKFDRALSIRRKIERGMSLEEQLRDDPNYINLPTNEFRKKLKEYEEEYLKPLDCIDRYLEYLGRDGLYNSISKGISDREGRWQAFLDYYKYVYTKLEDDRKRMNLGIEEDESGDVEEIAFKIIRQRDFPNLPKVHKIMRDLPKWIGDKDAKKELFKLLDIDLKLSPEECFDDEGNEIDERRKDLIWNTKHRSTLINQVKKARRLYERDKEKETPITLLEDALKKLEHENMQPDRINITDQPRAMKLAKQIKEVANQLESEFFRCMKNVKTLKDKYSKK
ncbi:MAG TPA: hypothetical protein VMW09_04795 [Desulfatiglandales bacterium]|nr:hypothetical protein [Desulfatiglandales bacterium]